jgi:sigma-B regulation protein RsbU (phosphoserine phosphatase)
MGVAVPSIIIYGIAGGFIAVIFILLFIALVIVTLVCRSTIHRITKPLTRFAESADQIAQGNLTAELPRIKSKDELMLLHESFSTMQTSLVKQMEEAKAANEEKGRIQGELSTARNIQMSMLPKKYPAFPERDDIDVYGLLTPAKEVGGDLYDFFIRDEKLFFCIGDVSGKGVPASLVMTVTRTLFRTVSVHESQPDHILGAINRAMSHDNESEMFVTLFIGVLDLPTGRLRYSNAGHNAPIIIGSDDASVLPCKPNIPIGIEKNWKFVPQETVILPATTIFIYTDGLTEAENSRHEQFQDGRVMDAARQCPHQPKHFIERMSEAVGRFVDGAEQSDDMTMVAIQYSHEQDKDITLHRSLTLPNDIEEVPRLAAFVDEVCEVVGFDMSTTMSINLALEEAVVNVMDYAYPAGTKGDVLVEAKANASRLKFVISDWGAPFDPTAKSEVDTTLSAEERPIGGLGIHLVRQIMDSINYERICGMNILTLRKKLTVDKSQFTTDN